MGIWAPPKTCFLGPLESINPNGISIGSAIFEQMNAECHYTLQWAALFPQNCPCPYVNPLCMCRVYTGKTTKAEPRDPKSESECGSGRGAASPILIIPLWSVKHCKLPVDSGTVPGPTTAFDTFSTFTMTFPVTFILLDRFSVDMLQKLHR